MINSGTIESTSTYAMYILDNTIGGDLGNSGLIDAGMGGDSYGLYIEDTTIGGDVFNSGTIRIGDYYGIYLYSSDVGGDFVNSGLIHMQDTTSYGQVQLYSSDITGNLTNSGTILAAGYYGLYLYETSIGGDFTNSGLIDNSVGQGVQIYSSDIAGNFTNSGTIIAETKYGLYLYGSDIGGNFTNSGLIDNTTSSGSGVFIRDSDIDGNFINSGTILADGPYGIYLYGSTIGGNFTNSGLIDNTDGYGVFVRNMDVGGNFTNSGTIFAEGEGIYLYGSTVDGSFITGSLIDATKEAVHIHDSTIGGSVTNNGTLIAGDDGLKIDSSSLIKGSVVNNGTIMADEDGLDIDESTTIEGSVVNNGTIMAGEEGFDIDSSTTIEGSLTNNGWIMASEEAFEISSSTIEGGIFNHGTITTTKTKVIDVDDMNALTTITNTGFIGGAVFFDDNILNLAGTSGRITGDTDGNVGSVVNVLGEFTTEGDFDVDIFNVAASGWLKVGSNITPTSGVNNLGVVAGLPGSVATITGNYTQTGAGALGAVLNSASSYSQLMVTGTADLSANDAVTVFVNALLTPGQVFDDILTAGTLMFGSDATDDSVLWKFSALKDGNTIDLVTERDALLSNLASPYAAEVGQVLDELLDSGQFSAEIRTILLQIAALNTAAEVTNAVDQLVSVLVGQGAFAAAQAVNQISDIVGNQIAAQNGLSAGDPMFREGHWWIKPFGGFGDHDVRNGVPGFDLQSYGIAVGADVKPNDNLLVGAAFAWSEAEIEADTISRNELDIQTFQIALYGSYNLDARNYIDAHAIVGWNDNESRRDVTIGTFTSTASADYDSFFTRIYAGLGRKYAVNDQFTVSPVISIRCTYIDEDGYTETGAPIALAVGSNDEDSLVLGLDGVGRYTFGAGNAYSITARAGVGYDAIMDRSLVSSTFVGGGSTFATRGAEPDEFVYHASFGLHSDPGAQTSVSIEYDFEGRQDFDVHGFSATVRWLF